MGWVVKATPRPLYPLLKKHYPLYSRLGGSPGPHWTVAETVASSGIHMDLRPWIMGLCIQV